MVPAVYKIVSNPDKTLLISVENALASPKDWKEN